MLRQSIVSTLIFLTVATAFTAIVPAQQPAQSKQEKQTEKVKTKVRQLGLGQRVKVKAKLYDNTTYQGYVKEANENDFVIIDKTGSPNIVKYSDVKSIGGGNLSTGAKIGIGIAIGAGAVIAVLLGLLATLD